MEVTTYYLRFVQDIMAPGTKEVESLSHDQVGSYGFPMVVFVDFEYRLIKDIRRVWRAMLDVRAVRPKVVGVQRLSV